MITFAEAEKSFPELVKTLRQKVNKLRCFDSTEKFLQFHGVDRNDLPTADAEKIAYLFWINVEFYTKRKVYILKFTNQLEPVALTNVDISSIKKPHDYT